jgi:SAM-dependent methyltransferase
VSSYGEHWADIYDEFTRWRFGPEATDEAVSFLAERAGPGPILELGIGTGRIALPLAERGIEVQGIDASEAMVDRLRAKPGGEAIPVTIGDFADVAVEGTFSLVFVVFNTLFALLTQDDQLRCFANVAARLADGGAFVVEAFVPDLTRYDSDQRVGALHMETDTAWLEASHHDMASQRVSSQIMRVSEEGVRLHPVELRYAWPSELDLMARLAGLRLRERWGGWQKEPFGSASASHVSVYEKGMTGSMFRA